MGVGTPLLFPGFLIIVGLGADVVVGPSDGADVVMGPSDGATVGDFSEGLLGALLGSGLVSGSSLSVGPELGDSVTSFSVGPNEGESVGSKSVGSSVVGSIVEGSSVVGSMVEGCNVEVDTTCV